MCTCGNAVSKCREFMMEIKYVQGGMIFLYLCAQLAVLYTYNLQY